MPPASQREEARQSREEDQPLRAPPTTPPVSGNQALINGLRSQLQDLNSKYAAARQRNRDVVQKLRQRLDGERANRAADVDALNRQITQLTTEVNNLKTQDGARVYCCHDWYDWYKDWYEERKNKELVPDGCAVIPRRSYFMSESAFLIIEKTIEGMMEYTQFNFGLDAYAGRLQTDMMQLTALPRQLRAVGWVG